MKKKKKTCILNIRSGVITTDPTDMKKMIREHYQQFYGDKFNNLDKMNKCFEKCNLQKLTQGLAEKKNWLIKKYIKNINMQAIVWEEIFINPLADKRTGFQDI